MVGRQHVEEEGEVDFGMRWHESTSSNGIRRRVNRRGPPQKESMALVDGFQLSLVVLRLTFMLMPLIEKTASEE